MSVLVHRVKLVAATIDELAARSDDRAEELCRMDRLGRVYNLDFLQATARHRHNTLLRPNNTAPGAAGDGGGEAVGGSSGLGQVAERAAAAAAAAAAASNTLPVTANAWGTCDICRCERMRWQVVLLRLEAIRQPQCLCECCPPATAHTTHSQLHPRLHTSLPDTCTTFTCAQRHTR